MDDAVDQVIDAIRAGLPVLLPTDTVYGLAASAEREDCAAQLYRLKGRPATQPTAFLAGTLEALFACVPELQGGAESIVRALLPGPYTLVLPNPARRYRWLTGTRSDTIGVRVPVLPVSARRVLDKAGCLIATSANDPGGPNPVSLDDVPVRMRSAVAAELDAGPLSGTPSTVLDFSGAEPRVIREGAAPAAAALERVRAALPG